MIYQNSRIAYDGATLFIAREGGAKYLYIQDKGDLRERFDGEVVAGQNGTVKRCPLTNANAKVIQTLFAFARPVRHRGHPFTMGLGNRLGLASPGHLRLLRNNDVFPVLAQQSMRELALTGRTYDDVLSAAVWAVFQEGYREGYGADGDHLKTREEVRSALSAGCTMITLDCSEHIHNGLGAVARFAAEIYHECLRGKDVDFELSIDENKTVTSPEDHLFVANALKQAGVAIVSLAPRFCGEFQKGIDYRGDVGQFAKEFAIHAQIARDMGYKLSIHSGSDKFSVFPVIYWETQRHVHVKTAGTNWLEALRVIAENNPNLFRAMVAFAVEHLPEAKQYYSITENTDNIPNINTLADSELSALLEQDDARQVLHVTYGLILSAKRADGTLVFKDAIYNTLALYEDDYYAALGARIGRHLNM
jgi:hypothetical protein